MIKVFDNLDQSSSAITERIDAIEGRGPMVTVSVRVHDARMDAEGDILLPPRRLANETTEDYQKRMQLYYQVTDPILEEGVRRNRATGDLEFYPAASDDDDARSKQYRQRRTAFEARTDPIAKQTQVTMYDVPEAIETWHVLHRLGQTAIDKSCANAPMLAELYEKAIKQCLDYLIDKYPERKEHFDTIWKNMQVAKVAVG